MDRHLMIKCSKCHKEMKSNKLARHFCESCQHGRLSVIQSATKQYTIEQINQQLVDNGVIKKYHSCDFCGKLFSSKNGWIHHVSKSCSKSNCH